MYAHCDLIHTTEKIQAFSSNTDRRITLTCVDKSGDRYKINAYFYGFDNSYKYVYMQPTGFHD